MFDIRPFFLWGSAIVLTALALVYWRWRSNRSFQLRLAKTVDDKKWYLAEKQRIAGLPKISTQMLMQVPDSYKSAVMYEQRALLPRTFCAQYNNVLVVDEEMRIWIGIITPGIIQDLMAGDYTFEYYRLPLKGAHCAFPAPSFTYEGVEVQTYPMWMDAAVGEEEWNRWLGFERYFLKNREDGSWDYHSEITKIVNRGSEIKSDRALFTLLREIYE
jgi:hypothetical protein